MEPCVIAHVDLDAFFASVEQLDAPALRGKPVLVGGTGPRSVVCAASYEARQFGCHAAMAMSIAGRLCPHAIVCEPRFSRYRELSARFMESLRTFSPLVEALSLDEAFVDLTGTQRLLGPPSKVAVEIPQRVKDATGLNCSVGVAGSKFVAKIASDLRKPAGVVVVPDAETVGFLAPLDIARMWGVGPVAAERFRTYGYRTFGDLQRVSKEQVDRDLGSTGEHAWQLANGIDSRKVEGEREAKRIGHEQTFDVDQTDLEPVLAILLAQVEAVASRLRSRCACATIVTIKIRTTGFVTCTRQMTLDTPTDSTSELWRSSKALLERWATGGFSPIRLIGVSVGGLRCEGNGGLFDAVSDERKRRLDRTGDLVRAKFGRNALSRAAARNLPLSSE